MFKTLFPERDYPERLQSATGVERMPRFRGTGRPLLLRPAEPGEADLILPIINAAAEAYRGVIPSDRWHEPYMTADQLEADMKAGVAFWVAAADGVLVGAMGVQPMRDVDLIRHAYVSPSHQGSGVGGALLGHLVSLSKGPVLVGTWAAAEWAIRFYQRHGFKLVPDGRRAEFLQSYWALPDGQAETSVVLALDALFL